MAITEIIEQELRDANRELVDENRRLRAELATLKGESVGKTSYSDLVAHAERLNLIVESTQLGTWDWDPVTDFVSWNEHACATFGVAVKDAPASFARTTERIHPSDAMAVRSAFIKHLERGDRFGIDLRARQSDGSFRWVHCCGRAMRDRMGCPIRVIGLLLDIDERKRAELGAFDRTEELNEKVNLRERELQLARQELEEFCYAVSHDLRTPLRSINGFSKAIESEYADKLDELGLDYLKRVQRASVTLADLLDSMLGMVRVSRVEVHPELVDLTTLAKSVISDFKESDPARKAEVRVAEGMEVMADPRLLRLLVTNLVSNAWKFTASVPTAFIEVAERDGAFYVKDNGAGFDMKYSDKMYKPFQKLHSSARFPGSGIGLTLSQRIAMRHGGTLWGESEGEGRGATFHFRMPPTSSKVFGLQAMMRIQPRLPMGQEE
jgi:PAS domain S-box-containing protein